MSPIVSCQSSLNRQQTKKKAQNVNKAKSEGPLSIISKADEKMKGRLSGRKQTLGCFKATEQYNVKVELRNVST